MLFSADLPWVSLDGSTSDAFAQSYQQVVDRAESVQAPSAEQQSAERQSFVAVDASFLAQQPVEANQILDQLRGANVHVALLDGALSGIVQLSGYLQNLPALASVGVLTTAESGGLQLGSDSLTTNTVLNHANEIAAWSGELDKSAVFNIQALGLADAQHAQVVEELLTSLTGTAVQVEGQIDLDRLLPKDSQGERRELVFVDSAVDDYETLIAEIQASSDTHRVLEVILLDPDQNGVAQISSVLAGYEGLDAIHIVSHGTEGMVQLGNASLSGQTLSDYESQLLQWRGALSEAADLLFYGCDLAGGADGQALIESNRGVDGYGRSGKH